MARQRWTVYLAFYFRGSSSKCSGCQSSPDGCVQLLTNGPQQKRSILRSASVQALCQERCHTLQL